MAAQVVLGVATVATAYLVASSLVSSRLLSYYTVVNELQTLGCERSKKLKKVAVICGGSVAGLLAARVCADHFEEVVIVDPDNSLLLTEETLLSGDAIHKENATKKNPRSRVAQYLAIHVSQVLNLMGLERLFPDFRARLKAMGAPCGPADADFYFAGNHIPPPLEYYNGSLPEWFMMTRAAYEPLLRKLVRENCVNCRFVTGTVTGVVPGADGRIQSITYRQSSHSTTLTTQTADLVIDCSGRLHAGVGWLEHAGCGVSASKLQESYNPHTRYTSSEFIVDPAVLAEMVPGGFDRSRTFLLFLLVPVRGENRYFALWQYEGNRLVILTGGPAFSQKTKSVAEIKDFFVSFELPKASFPWVGNLFDYLETIEDTATHVDTPSPPMHYIKYHKYSSELPSNFIAIGDAVMELNPIYGNGMTKSLIGAIVLNTCLYSFAEEDIPSIFSSRFFMAQNAKTEHVWDYTKKSDYGQETCTPASGETLAMGKLTRWWSAKLGVLQVKGDKDIIRRAYQIREWLGPPTLRFAPSVILKVLWSLVPGH